MSRYHKNSTPRISTSRISTPRISTPPLWRQYLVLTVMTGMFVVLGGRVAVLQIQDNEMLQAQGNKRYLREVLIPPERGKILDRNGQVLSVSTPVDSLAADPKLFCRDSGLWGEMPSTIGLSKAALADKCERFKHSDFMYIKRRLPPHVVSGILNLNIPGVEVRREYKRYFPGGPVSAHLVGFTDSDDNGQEGLELTHNNDLSGREGKKRVLKALAGHYVESVESIRQVRDGLDLQISIDQRVQSLASQYLQTAVQKHKAVGGSVVVVAVPSGEIISMVNAPQFNPNDRSTIKSDVIRNRAVTDSLEPGSTTKPFTIAMALESGDVTPHTLVDTSPGYYHIGEHTINDVRDNGALPVFDVLVRSSNIGSAKLALQQPPEDLYNMLHDVGFGKKASSLPGEIDGLLKKRTRKIEHATLAYGYGFSVTPLQLARAYTVFATDGKLLPLTLNKKEVGYQAKGRRVMQAETAVQVRAMLEQAATATGTAPKAKIERYRIGGKTGTTHKLIDGSYVNNRYVSLFAGVAPISNPRFVMVVSIDDPRGQFYYGGDVAAPVFSSLMADLMRLYNIEPDALAERQTELAHLKKI